MALPHELPSTFYTCDKKCCKVEIMINKDVIDQIGYPIRSQNRKAGIFVYDPNTTRVLLVQSRGYLWSIPKGSVESDINESNLSCAIRELYEETGITVEPSKLTRAVLLYNRALYYYTEMDYHDVTLQKTENNDANGITWMKLSCLEECVNQGKIMLNNHTRLTFKKFLNKTFPKSDFVTVKRKR